MCFAALTIDWKAEVPFGSWNGTAGRLKLKFGTLGPPEGPPMGEIATNNFSKKLMLYQTWNTCSNK